MLIELSVMGAGFLLSACLTGLFKNISLKHRILIYRDTPLIGGISIWLSFVLAFTLGIFLGRNVSQPVKGIIVASLIMLVFGVIDDRQELSVAAKFFVQIVTVCFLVFLGVETEIVTIGKAANLIITFVWILGITNAFNHLDIMDGLAAVTAVIVSLAFFVISFMHQSSEIAILSLALAGSVCGFLIYNFPPARVYMGNAGSHFLGFILASIALIISYAPMDRKIALLSPVLILGLAVFDTAFLIFIRLIKKNLPFNKSNDHLALRFLFAGYTTKKTLLVMFGLCLFFAVCGIAISQASNIIGAFIMISAVLVSLIITYRMGRLSIR